MTLPAADEVLAPDEAHRHCFRHTCADHPEFGVCCQCGAHEERDPTLEYEEASVGIRFFCTPPFSRLVTPDEEAR